LISSKDMVSVMKIVSEWPKDFDLPGYDKDNHTGLLRHLMVRQSQITRELMAALFATEAPGGDLTEAVNALVMDLTSEIESLESRMWMENREIADVAQDRKRVG